MINAYIFDIDGTLADATHRLPMIQGELKDWDGFYKACVDDTVIENVARIYKTLRDAGYYIILMTGRSEDSQTETMEWLLEHDLNPRWLLMRPSGDHRPDYIVKKELYEKWVKPNFNVIGVFEDRTSVVQMWREIGLTCFQVDQGDF